MLLVSYIRDHIMPAFRKGPSSGENKNKNKKYLKEIKINK